MIDGRGNTFDMSHVFVDSTRWAKIIGWLKETYRIE